MEIMQPSVELLEQGNDPCKLIELAGRTCYKSEGNIKEGSSDNFVEKIVDRQHEAMIEHFNFILSISANTYFEIEKDCDVENFKFINITGFSESKSGMNIISGSARGFKNFYKETGNAHMKSICQKLKKFSQPLFKDIDDEVGFHSVPFFAEEINIKSMYESGNLSEKETLSHIYETFRIICDRGVTHEVVRHRVASYAQESTRYCNYGKIGEIRVIDLATGFKYDLNSWFDKRKYDVWEKAMKFAEHSYMQMLDFGATPQEARSVLPNSTKTEIIMTANLREYVAYMKLRPQPSAHPQMQQIAIPMNNLLHIKYTDYFNRMEEF